MGANENIVFFCDLNCFVHYHEVSSGLIFQSDRFSRDLAGLRRMKSTSYIRQMDRLHQRVVISLSEFEHAGAAYQMRDCTIVYRE